MLRASAARDGMGVINGNGEGDDDDANFDEDDNEGDAEGDRRIGQAGGEARRLGGKKGDQSWTRGPTQLQYDDDDGDDL